VTFDNREWAALFWLTVFLLWALSTRDVRSSLSRLLRSLFNPVILIPLAAMFGYVALEVWVGYKLSVWHTGLMKSTIIWLIASALAMFFSYDKASEGRQFFRRGVVAALGGMFFVEFFVNLTVFSLFWELLLQPVLTILVLLSFVANLNNSHHKVKKLIDGLLAIIVFSLFALIARELYSTWDEIDRHILLLQLALPIWLTIGFLPCVYLLCLYANYDLAFKGINHATKDWNARLRAKLVT
jgi:hypothetical protein